MNTPTSAGAEPLDQDLRSRSSQLRGKLGFKNEQLLGFGIPPRRKPVRRKERGGADRQSRAEGARSGVG